MVAALRPPGWATLAFNAPALLTLRGPGVKGQGRMDARAAVAMEPVMLAAAAQEGTGMEGTVPWGSQTPGRAVPRIPSAGFSSGMGGATHSATLRSVFLMAMTVRSLQPAPQPMTSTAEITSTTGTVRKAATTLSVAGTGVTAGQKGTTQRGAPPWPCWWC